MIIILENLVLKVLNDSIFPFILKVITTFSRLLFSIIIAQLLGANDTGIYFLALSIIMFTSEVSKLGIDNIIVRFTAAYNKQKKYNKIKGLMNLGVGISFISSLFFFLLIILFSDLISIEIFEKKELIIPLKIMSVGVITFSLMRIISEGFRGLSRISESIFYSNTMFILLSIIFLPTAVKFFGLNGPSIVFVITTSIVLLVSYIFWINQKNLSNVQAKALSIYKFKNIAKPLWLMTVINQGIIPWFPIIALGIFSTSNDVGIFSSAYRFAVLLTFFLGVANTILAPKYSQLFLKEKINKVESLAKKSSLLIFILSLPVFIIIFCNANYFMSFFGPEFVSGEKALKILLIGQIFNVFTGSVGNILIMSGNEQSIMKASIFGSICTIFFSFFLIPSYGMNGAALASTVSIIAINSLSYYYVIKKIRIFPTVYLKIKNEN